MKKNLIEYWRKETDKLEKTCNLYEEMFPDYIKYEHCLFCKRL